MAKKSALKIEDWLLAASQSGFNAGRLAHQLQVSRRQLQRYTHQHFGASPQAWLDQRRLMIAVNMLIEKRLIKYVSAELGFSDVSNFSHRFKRLHGLSPKRFLVEIDKLRLRNWQPAKN